MSYRRAIIVLSFEGVMLYGGWQCWPTSREKIHENCNAMLILNFSAVERRTVNRGDGGSIQFNNFIPDSTEHIQLLIFQVKYM